jgi:hypothetical protein
MFSANEMLMKKSLICVALVLAVASFAGCSRKSSDASKTDSAQMVQNLNQASVQPPQPEPASATPTVAQPGDQVSLAEINHAARFWMFRNRRRPTDWDDFAAHAGVTIPPPPPGKKYALSRDMRVTLVDQ